MRDWLPDEHLVWLVLDVVDQLDISRLTAGYVLGGVGRRAFDPRMMLALLVYGYCRGVRSSRAIERSCHTDVAFRVLCAQDPPDHTRIARFRQAHLDVFEDLFTQVLLVCARAGYVRLGIVAIDGTKIAANASIEATHERDWYAAKVAEMTAQAAAVDAAEDAQFGPDRHGDEPPDSMSGHGRAGRAARLRRCLQEITATEADLAETAQSDRRAAQDYLADVRAGRARQGRAPRGVDPVVLAETVLERELGRHGPQHWRTRRAHARLADARDQAAARPPQPARKHCRHGTACRGSACQPPPVRRNSTDPDSRLMSTKRGFIQGYNAQLAASADHFIIAADLVQDTNDAEQLQPMMTAAGQAADRIRHHQPDPDPDIGVVLADNGYCSTANLTTPGPDRLIATGKRRRLNAATDPTSGPPPETATPHQAMDHRLRTPEGAALYKKRAATIEPINGNLKDRGQLRQFLLRGQANARAELHLAALAHNLRHLHNLTQPA